MSVRRDAARSIGTCLLSSHRSSLAAQGAEAGGDCQMQHAQGRKTLTFAEQTGTRISVIVSSRSSSSWHPVAV